MRARVEIQGIEDVEPREAIRGLRVGAFVKLSLLAGPQGAAGETLLVQITRISADAFRGTLASRPATAALSGLRVGLALAFTRSHIHSLATGRANRGAVTPRRSGRDRTHAAPR